MNGQGFLTAAQRSEVRHRPIEPGKTKQPGDQSRGLSQRQSEERLQPQAGLDRGVRGDRLTPAPAGRRGQRSCIEIKPDRK